MMCMYVNWCACVYCVCVQDPFEGIHVKEKRDIVELIIIMIMITYHNCL